MMRRSILAIIFLILISGCANTLTGNAVVAGVGEGDLLKLRSGPGFNHRIIIGLPNDTSLRQDRCVNVEKHLWCRVSLLSSPRMTGYVSARYLVAR